LLTILRHLKQILPMASGQVLDVGCGQSPYKFLLNPNATIYNGIDVQHATDFKYENQNITYFNGKDIPFANNYFDFIICTEVLEHVEHYQYLVNEMHRVLKPNGQAIITIPFSARYHYIPWDYFRYTPSSLKTIFSAFENTQIKSRGTDITVIANKMIVILFRWLMPLNKWRYLALPFVLLTVPFFALFILLGHASLWFNIGANVDPLGYTIQVKK
jgi:ubiquinone/menaquinone biosynthesis C-methylase UbiE